MKILVVIAAFFASAALVTPTVFQGQDMGAGELRSDSTNELSA